MAHLTRRRLIAAGGLSGAALLASKGTAAGQHDHGANGGPAVHAGHEGTGHADFRDGRTVDHASNGFDPHELLRDFDWGRTTRTASGQVVREWELTALDREIEVAPGVKFAAWTYNGRVPGPTLRCREGERLRITFANASAHPHTIHFHGIHPAEMDGVPGLGGGQIEPGGKTVYEFDALPAGLHLYHCHVRPLAEHIAKGLYGAFIVDPPELRTPAQEIVMVMNGFDTDGDGENNFYTVNGRSFFYAKHPLTVSRSKPVRIYLANLTEFDLINSFHLHGDFFRYYPTGRNEPVLFTDTVMQCQGERGILEIEFANTGLFMFHAHQSEFAELGWMGFFNVVD